MMLKGVIFDHDGTLVDSEVTHYQIWKTVLKKYAIELPEEEYKSEYSGAPTAQNAEVLVAKYLPKVKAENLAKEKEAATQAFLRDNLFPLMPHVRELLEFFKACGLRLGIATGAKPVAVASTLRGHRLEGYFETLATGDDVARNKPNPDVYLYALKQLGLSADECIAIEDSESGVRAAARAGLICCGVVNEYSRNHDFSQAAEVFENLEQARHWIVEKFLQY